MTPTRKSPPRKASGFNLRSEVLPGHGPVLRKRKTTGWLRGRRPEMQPWRRGRIRPSSCHDLDEKA